MTSVKIAKNAGIIGLILLVSLYLLIPVKMCGASCPTCLGSSVKTSASQTEEMPSCHQSQAPSCHQSQAAENQCTSQPGKPHQCCIKSAPLLGTSSGITFSTQPSKFSNWQISQPGLVSHYLKANSSALNNKDYYQHRFKEAKLFLLTSALLI